LKTTDNATKHWAVEYKRLVDRIETKTASRSSLFYPTITIGIKSALNTLKVLYIQATTPDRYNESNGIETIIERSIFCQTTGNKKPPLVLPRAVVAS